MKKIFIKSSLLFLGVLSAMPAFFIPLTSTNINLKEVRNINKENVHFSSNDIQIIKFGNKELSGDYSDDSHIDKDLFGNPFELNYFCNLSENDNYTNTVQNKKGCINEPIDGDIANTHYPVYWPSLMDISRSNATPWGQIFPNNSNNDIAQPGIKNMGSFFNELINGNDSIKGPFISNNNDSGLLIDSLSLGQIQLEFILPEFRDMKIYLDDNNYQDENFVWSASMRVEGEYMTKHPLLPSKLESFIQRYDLRDMTVTGDATNEFILEKKDLMPDDPNNPEKFVVENPHGTWVKDPDNYNRMYFPLSTYSAFKDAKQKAGNYLEDSNGDLDPTSGVRGPKDLTDDAWLYNEWINLPSTKLDNYQLNKLIINTTDGPYEYRLAGKVDWQTKMYAYTKGEKIDYSYLYNHGYPLSKKVEIKLDPARDPKPWEELDKAFGIILGIWVGSVALGTLCLMGISYLKPKKNYNNK